jgi:anti-anti-sigma factor
MEDSREPQQPRKPEIEVEAISAAVAVVTLRGEHDLGAKSELADALAVAGRQPHVVVDLSECTFIDSTVLALLLAAHRSQIERAGRLDLVIPSSARAIQRITNLARIDTLLTVHETRSGALAGIDTDE